MQSSRNAGLPRPGVTRCKDLIELGKSVTAEINYVDISECNLHDTDLPLVVDFVNSLVVFGPLFIDLSFNRIDGCATEMPRVPGVDEIPTKVLVAVTPLRELLDNPKKIAVCLIGNPIASIQMAIGIWSLKTLRNSVNCVFASQSALEFKLVKLCAPLPSVLEDKKVRRKNALVSGCR